MNTIYIKQINANICYSSDNFSKEFITKLLEYTATASYFDRSIGKRVVKFSKKSFAIKQKKNIFFPVGLIDYIIDKSNEQNISINIEYVEPYVIKQQKPKLPNITFEDYQIDLLNKIKENKRGILICPTGGGKTTVLGGIASALKIPETVIIVPNQTIFNQMYKSFCSWFGKNNVGQIGQGILNQKKITVCLYQSLIKYKIKKSLKLLLCDEVHMINTSIINFLKKCDHVYYRYGVTATPQKFKNNLLKAFEMEGYIGPILHEVEEKEVSARVLPVKVKMINFYCSNPSGTTYQKVLRQDVLLSTVRNTKFLKAAKELILDKNLTCLILIDETKQGEKIIEIAEELNIDITLVHGKQDKEYIKSIIEKLNKRQINCVVATKVFGVGLDIPNVDSVVLASARKSEIDTLQKIGRSRRNVKTMNHAIVIDSIDNVKGTKRYVKHFYKHSLERLNIYKEKKWDIEKLTF